MQKLILKCSLAPGDILMLTAAVRDLHRCYPGRFLTDVRTCCAGLWENNPHVTTLADDDPEAQTLDCSYPLINHCNETPYHCLHGFIDFLNQRLGLRIKPTAFHGHIHLSDLEKSWHSQVQEATGEDTPFWIVAAGGKFDITIKWWQTERYQKVVDHFRGRILFVQVGQYGHHHPKLEGAIDLRGRTDLRELVRLVHHSQGVLCSITALMHLAAAVELRANRAGHRPCVVVAGGREPAHWEAYPGHQFLHTIGALPCCARGGCWKDRVVPLRDGDKRDRSLCVDVVNGLPRCLDMITAEAVIHRIETYFHGGMLQYLSERQRQAGERGIAATAATKYDNQPLRLGSAGMACERFLQKLPENPGGSHGKGIVICGGGVRYFTNAWVCIQMLRRLGCTLPIQLWYLNPGELDARMKALLTPLGVECVDASRVRRKHPVRTFGAWQLKPYAILHCPFEEVLLLDADNVPIANPEYLFNTPQYQASGAIFWPDLPHKLSKKMLAVWRSCGLRRPPEPEFESGQVLVHKSKCWKALRLCGWFNEHSDFYYQHLHGDKDTFQLAFRKLKQPYALVDTPVQRLTGTMCQHDFEGNRIFQHRNTDKWNLLLQNKRVPGFRFEGDCRRYVKELQHLWDGGVRSLNRPALKITAHLRSAPSIQAVVISCAERRDVLRKTMKHLARTDWDIESVHVQLDDGTGDDHRARQTANALRALQWSLGTHAEYVLFLEDDLTFNRHLRHNLERWRPLRAREITLAGLYNPDLRAAAYDLQNQAMIVEPNAIYGSQAFLLSRPTVEHLVRHWNRGRGMQDLRISRLVGWLKQPLFYHCPSLIQHVGRSSVWGGVFHQAPDFDAEWKSK